MPGRGAVKDLDFQATRLHLRPDRDGEHPCACGGLQWVQVGSTTEFYRFWDRPDVCRPGAHVTPEAREYAIELPLAPAPADLPRVSTFYERACPEHLARLHAQWPGANIRPVRAGEPGR